MTNLPITIEDMQPKYNREVSFLLAHAFQGKFAALTKLDIRSLAVYFGQLLELFPDGSLNRRMVARQGDKIVGTLSLKWHKSLQQCLGTAAALHGTLAPSAKLSRWKGFSKLGTKNTLLLLAALYFLNHEPSPGECYIADLAVHPEHQGQGAGGLLIRQAQQFIRNQPGLHYLSLHVSGSNGQAKRLYERLSFSASSEEHSLFSSFLFQEKVWTYMICRQQTA